MQVKNNKTGINQFYKRIIKATKVDQKHWLLCMEHTGIYCNPLLISGTDKDLALWLEDASRIKAFHGLERGKNDALDALRIAQYACAKKAQARLYKVPRKLVTQLKSQIKLRERLVTSLPTAGRQIKVDSPPSGGETLWRQTISQTT